MKASLVVFLVQIPLIASRYDTTRTTCRAGDERVALVVRVTPYLFQHDGWRRSSSAYVYKFSLLCSGLLSVSETAFGRSEADMSTLWRRPEHVTSVSHLSHACCAVLPYKWDTSRQDFSICQNAWAGQRVVTCLDMTWRAKWNLVFC